MPSSGTWTGCVRPHSIPQATVGTSSLQRLAHIKYMHMSTHTHTHTRTHTHTHTYTHTGIHPSGTLACTTIHGDTLTQTVSPTITSPPLPSPPDCFSFPFSVSPLYLPPLLHYTLQFVHETQSRQLLTCADDRQVRHHDLVAKEPLSVWHCSTARVKRLATLPAEPALIWSAAEDGLVRYVDWIMPDESMSQITQTT